MRHLAKQLTAVPPNAAPGSPLPARPAAAPRRAARRHPSRLRTRRDSASCVPDRGLAIARAAARSCAAGTGRPDRVTRIGIPRNATPPAPEHARRFSRGRSGSRYSGPRALYRPDDGCLNAPVPGPLPQPPVRSSTDRYGSGYQAAVAAPSRSIRTRCSPPRTLVRKPLWAAFLSANSRDVYNSGSARLAGVPVSATDALRWMGRDVGVKFELPILGRINSGGSQPRRDSWRCSGRSQCIGNNGKRQNELQLIVEQWLCAKPFVPACRLGVLRVNRERHTANFRCHRQRPFACCQKQVATEPLALCRSVDGQAPQTKDWYVMATELSGQGGRDAGELDSPRADRVEAENSGWLQGGSGNEGLGTSGFVVLTRVTAEILVQGGVTAIKGLAVMMPADGFFAPVEQEGYARAARRRAAASSAAVGSGGFSSSSNTRAVSRSDSTMRSDRSTTSRAAGSAFRRMKLVTSSLSRAAAVARRRFSSLVARNSIRSVRAVTVVVGMDVSMSSG